MTPKEKAIEILNNCKRITSFEYQEYAGANYSEFNHCEETLKELSLMCVDEIIKAMPESAHITMIKVQRPFKIIDYWDEVKVQIDNNYNENIYK